MPPYQVRKKFSFLILVQILSIVWNMWNTVRSRNSYKIGPEKVRILLKSCELCHLLIWDPWYGTLNSVSVPLVMQQFCQSISS